MILVWEALGCRLAYKKGQIVYTVTWVGGIIFCEKLGIRVTIKDTTIQDIKADLLKSLARPQGFAFRRLGSSTTRQGC